LPLPVAPATSRCGIFARSVIIGRPALSRPSRMGSANLPSTNSRQCSSGFMRTFSRMGFGTSMPIVFLPGIGATMRTERARSAMARSSSRLRTRSTLMPGASSISNMEMTGPFWISTTRASILKDSSVRSSSAVFSASSASSSLWSTLVWSSSRSSVGKT
jgi:hypothetical protein